MTLFAVTIHPETDFAVLLSHVQNFRSLGDSKEIPRERAGIIGRNESQELSVGCKLMHVMKRCIKI